MSTPTTEDAEKIGARYLAAVAAVRESRFEEAVEALVGPRTTDDDAALTDLFTMFNAGALITGRIVRRAMADPEDPTPLDGPAALHIFDARSGLPAHPDDLDRDEKLVVWAVAAGANLDIESIGAHGTTIWRRGREEALVKALVFITRLCAAAYDLEARR